MNSALPAISEVSDAALAAWLSERGEPVYRLRQIRRHLFDPGPGPTSSAPAPADPAARSGKALPRLEDEWSTLTDIPKRLREQLAGGFLWSSVEPVTEVASADGETRKALLALNDGHRIETVLMPHHGARNSVCISTQAGCPMACAFCATGEMGLIRNLTAGEIVDQVRHWQRELAAAGDRVSHVVYMGMGEPLNNYDATMGSARTLMDPEAFGISPRRITISTCGIVPKIDALAGEGMPLNLAISLHAPDDTTRTAIMPINRKWGVEEVLAAAARYVKRTKRRVTFEYVMLGGVNDSPATARRLAERITQHMRAGAAHLNLIPYNPGPGGFKRPAVEVMERFAAILEERGIAATVRISKGQDIAAACGQLKVPEGKAAPLELTGALAGEV